MKTEVNSIAGRTIKLNVCNASQQTTYTHSQTGVARVASFAKDGDLNSISCTNGITDFSWWSADICQPRHVTAVHIYADSNANHGE